MSPKQRYWLAVALIVLTLGLLYPGLTKNALTIRGVLDIEGVGAFADKLTSVQIPPERLAQVRGFMNPAKFGRFTDEELSTLIGRLVGGVIRGTIDGASRAPNRDDTVYIQTQTILVTIRYLYENGGYLAATLLLLFSVCVPVGKILVFFMAIHAHDRRREALLSSINLIGKWSMADVFVVAIYTAYLGAKNSVGVGQPFHFEATYGPGFYWFTAYCVVSLAAQQAAVGLIREQRRAHACR